MIKPYDFYIDIGKNQNELIKYRYEKTTIFNYRHFNIGWMQD